MNAIFAPLISLPPEWALFVLLMASLANTLLAIKATDSAIAGRARTAFAQFLIHTAIIALILWATFAVGFLA